VFCVLSPVLYTILSSLLLYSFIPTHHSRRVNIGPIAPEHPATLDFESDRKHFRRVSLQKLMLEEVHRLHSNDGEEGGGGAAPPKVPWTAAEEVCPAPVAHKKGTSTSSTTGSASGSASARSFKPKPKPKPPSKEEGEGAHKKAKAKAVVAGSASVPVSKRELGAITSAPVSKRQLGAIASASRGKKARASRRDEKKL
jgi:hypothetical protein